MTHTTVLRKADATGGSRLSLFPDLLIWGLRIGVICDSECN